MAETAISIGALIVSLVSLAVSVYFSRFKLKADVTPVLVFTHPDRYWLENFGNGPALDVVVFDSKTGGADFVRAVSCYPISKGSHNDIIWVKHPGRLGVTYKDIYGNQYTSFCQDDQVKILRGHLVGHGTNGLTLDVERAIRCELRNSRDDTQ